MTEQAHSRFGGSSADRVINCSGSTALLASIIKKPSGSYDAEGTLAHALGEYALRQGWRDAVQLVDGHPYLDKKGIRLGVSSEMVDAIQVYLDAVWDEVDAAPDAVLLIEQGFDLDIASADPGEVFGRNDAAVYSAARKRLTLFDYKHGVGVAVNADDNAQMRFYAAGAVMGNPDWRVTDLGLTIVQPRSWENTLEDPVQRWPTDVEGLLEFLADYDQAVAKAKKAEAHFLSTGEIRETDLNPGPWCRWCDAAGAAACPAREKAVLQAAQLPHASITDISAADLPEPKTMDLARLGQVLKAGKLLNDWLNQIESYVEALLLAGTPIEGWKVVEKIGRAKWASADEKVQEYLDLMFGVEPDLVRPRKLTTITNAVALLKAAGAKKEDIEDFKLKFTIKESSGLTTAPASDRRPAVDAAADASASLDTTVFKA